MTITQEDELIGLQDIGRIVANTLQAMAKALEPGITTAELDAIGRSFLEREGARSAPEDTYGFPGITCISVGEEIAHGIPGPRQIQKGDLVNIDVSASKNGYFADTGASFRVPPSRPVLDRLCKDGQRALEIGLAEVVADRPLAGIGQAIGKFAKARGYSQIRNLCSHGVGRALHEDPKEIPTWPTNRDQRRIGEGLVLTVEPYLSLGGLWAETRGRDRWTLYAQPSAPTVQYEHTVVATRNGPLVLTLPG